MKQSGFTLVEIAIVLVIIGLLLGGILKGQELVNSAKAKHLTNDFRKLPAYLYAYQDKFKALPGDDKAAQSHLPGGVAADNGNGNGVIDGPWNSTAATDESYRFWRHVRLANLVAGSTDLADLDYLPRNALGGKLGVSGATAAQIHISGMSGTYQMCSTQVTGKIAKQIDIQVDDGNTATGSVRIVLESAAAGSAAIATSAVVDGDAYTVCMTF